MSRAFRLRSVAIVLLVCGVAASCAGPNASAPDDGFTPLFDGASLDGWVVENTDAGNFSVVDGALRVEGPVGWLRTERTYADFDLRVEFRFLTDNADSGVFVRVGEGDPFARGWPGNSYQVQTRDISVNTTTRPKLLGDVYRHRLPDGPTEYDDGAAFAAFTGTGAWQTFEIEVVGDRITVHLNDTLLTRAAEVVNPEGWIGLQGETGIVEFRRIDIRVTSDE